MVILNLSECSQLIFNSIEMSKAKASEPIKRIYEESDVKLFQRSLASQRLHELMSFLVEKVTGVEVPKYQLQPAIVTRSPHTQSEVSKVLNLEETRLECTEKVRIILDIISLFDKLIDETPPQVGPRRFGNMACRDWHAKVKARSLEMLKTLGSTDVFITELNYYMVNSFGSEMRLDYGSGHELSFIAFIGGLFLSDILNKDVSGQEILAMFCKYYDLVRRLILEYSLEPAGSHGVWGLDDHFHFIYILGAAEFNSRHEEGRNDSLQYVPPVLQVLSSHTISSYKTSNLYVNAIAFIFKLKLGPFHEHSPVLYDIHNSVSLWNKVESGLLKMYEVEVFGKFPVVQHFWFGDALYPWKDVTTAKLLPVTRVEDLESTSEDTRDNLPGLINGLQGSKTKSNNISMTGAPWARKGTFRGTRAQSDRAIGRNI